MPHAYPILLDLTGRLAVIVGGGAVAVRKASGLLAGGATRVRVVSPVFDERMPAAVERVAARYDATHLDGATLAFAATDDPAVNEQVVRDGGARNVLVNRADADDDVPGDFATLALLRQGAVTVAVSAGGSPTLAARVRDDLAAKLDLRWVALADAMRLIRPRVLATVASEERRRAMFRDAATADAADVLARGGVEALVTWLEERHCRAKV
ncbi:MAG TPA: bifunctional precorrin-2 dehydrogenase/sirohydrochlorin ferrochelatase [Tepidisphaeraceae bacterium]|nr:bifunctional precorrin-2 dehydrogenase/sirohydrochlorin ferrochelatase [Tepidisphaeraceae bacterium]